MNKQTTTTTHELNRACDLAADKLRSLEAVGASRSLTSSENIQYRLAESEYRNAVHALSTFVNGANLSDSSLAIALRNVEGMERGTARSVNLHDLGHEVRGTATLVEGTAGVGGNTVNADAVSPEIFRAYRDHRSLLNYIPEEVITVRASTFDIPVLSAGATTTAPGENAPVIVSDMTFGRVPVTWTKTNTTTAFSYELAHDQPFGLESLVSEEHGRAGVRAVEAAAVTQLVASAGNAVAAAPTTIATILDGAIAVEVDGHTPTVAVLSPTDWGVLRKSNSAAIGSAERFKEMTGLDLVLSSSLATGTGLVLSPEAVRVYRRSMLPVRVIRDAAGFATDTTSVVSAWRHSTKVLATDGVCKLAA